MSDELKNLPWTLNKQAEGYGTMSALESMERSWTESSLVSKFWRKITGESEPPERARIMLEKVPQDLLAQLVKSMPMDDKQPVGYAGGMP